MINLVLAFFCALMAYLLSDSALTASYAVQSIRSAFVRHTMTFLLLVITALLVVVLLFTALYAVHRYLI